MTAVKPFRQSKFTAPVAVVGVLVFVALGYLVVSTRTAGHFVPIQAEQRRPSGTTVVGDTSSASGGNLARFSASETIPASFFGMHLIEKSHWPTVPVGALGKGTFVLWPYVSPSRGVYDWSSLDAWVAQAEAHGVPMFLALEQTPQWAAKDPSSCKRSYGYVRCTGMVANLQDYDDYVRRLATRYKGRIAMYELYNEPHRPESWTGSIADMVTLTRHAHDIIRSVDPGAIMAAPSGNRTFMDQYWTAGGVKTVDVLTIHAYPNPAKHTSRAYAAAERVCCGNFLIGPMKAVFAKHGLKQPIWDTEGSWTFQRGSMTDPDTQSAFVVRWHLLHWSEGIRRVYWYAWDNDTWGTLWDPSAGERKPAKAYREVYGWMVGAVMPEPCAQSGPATSDLPKGTIFTCKLTRPGGYQALAVWNTNGTSSYNPPTAYLRLRDLDGNVMAIAPGSPITIGFKPVLLETRVP
jgi:polysaccharide biosynthesis protein PslG